MIQATQASNRPIAVTAPAQEADVPIIRKHHVLVRWSHWLNVPILLGLILSGMSIYWAAPVYQHKPDPLSGNVDVVADSGIWICAHVPGLHHYSSPPDWVYNHMSFGTYSLSSALRLHPGFTTKYNALQRLAYFSVPVAGFLSVATGWAIHKPMQLPWLAAVFGGYDMARIWHFWLMWLFIFFVVPHVILVFSDGWDTLRSMIVGYSKRVERKEGLGNER